MKESCGEGLANLGVDILHAEVAPECVPEGVPRAAFNPCPPQRLALLTLNSLTDLKGLRPSKSPHSAALLIMQRRRADWAMGFLAAARLAMSRSISRRAWASTCETWIKAPIPISFSSVHRSFLREFFR